MAKKESEFVKRIKKLEREGYQIDGGIILFTSKTGASALTVEGECNSSATVALRANEHVQLELDLMQANRKDYVESKTKSALGTSPTEIPSYTK